MNISFKKERTVNGKHQEKKSGGEKTTPKTPETQKNIAPVEISYKVDEQEININSEDINQLFADIKKYNDQFSLAP